MNEVDVLTIVNWFRVQNNADLRENPENVDELTQMKVMKLLYYVQGVFLALYNQRAFNSSILAWKYGPVVREVHNAYYGEKGIVNNKIPISEDDANDFALIETLPRLSDVIHSVQDTYGEMSAIELMKQTHTEAPWVETWRNEQENGSDVINDDLIRNYFRENIVEI